MQYLREVDFGGIGIGMRLLYLRLATFISSFYPAFANTPQGIFSDECSVASDTSNPLGWV